MNRKNLTAAVLAGLAGAAGIAGTAQAVNQNPDGLGEVLIYPYYTVNNGNFTFLSVVNTTDRAKAVKVRFLEGMNSQEVLDFNLYMSAYDVWAAAVVEDGDGGAALEVTDTSCTVPGIETQADQTQPFITLKYEGDDRPGSPFNGDDGPTGRDRLTEGHFEIIEMGELFDDGDFMPATWATHVNELDDDDNQLYHPDGTKMRRPAGCDHLVRAWAIEDDVPGVWVDDEEGPDTGLEAPGGGLFGGAGVVNVGEGTMFTYDARALNGYSSGGFLSIQHYPPGSELPSLASGDNYVANIFTDSGDAVSMNFDLSVDAVSAVFMHDKVMNEYNLSSTINTMSEWVVTFPTKREYTYQLGGVARAPFTEHWSDYDNDTVYDGACELILLGDKDMDRDSNTYGERNNNGVWDREEDSFPTIPPETEDVPPIFSPGWDPESPPPRIPVSKLCYEVNVVRFGAIPEGGYEGPSEILGSSRVLAIATESDDENYGFKFNDGWAMIDLLDATDPNSDDALEERWLVDTDDQFVGGLPVTGFWVLSFNSGKVNSGTLGNYGGLFNHKLTRKFSNLD